MAQWMQCSFVGHGITWADSTCSIVAGGGTSRGHIGKKKKKRDKVIRWAEFATSEERRIALAKALAAADQPLVAVARDSEEDSIIEEEDALITALVMSRVIH